MTATQPETTALAKRANLSPEMEARIEERKLHSAMVQKIRGATWGNTFDAHTIAAVAAWARENDVDPITEIDVLGGNLYLRARFYERKLSELVAAGQIEYFRPDWVHVDKRIEKLADAGDEEMKYESRRRLKERISHNLSDDATHACIYRIKHRQMTEEATGAKELVPGKRKDPVGDAMPMETIETRSCRRAMLKLKEAGVNVRVASTNDDSTVEVAEIVATNHEQVKAEREVRQIAPAASTFEAPPIDQEQADLALDAQIVADEG